MVRIAKLLLRITIALSVTFIIYQAIKYAMAMNNESDQSATQQKLINIIIGIAIALGSLSIILLLQSFTINTTRELQTTVTPLQDE
jgi:uncharacterized membrane protein YwzB